ncbi:MAG: IMP cyclohydrolase [Oscillospiraceae bacterium]|nr:IMP cyclohydrolase [Oscillospiraceae bacterium]
MKATELGAAVGRTSYPGRGIILGRSEDNKSVYIGYFIMGRSENSRNRVFEETSDGIRTAAWDPSKVSDPSLIIYHPVRRYNGCTIVTNGDQTDTIRDYMAEGFTIREALLSREFEPDSPNYTPRISGMVMPTGNYKLSILKTYNGDPSCCCRYLFEYDKPIAGQGHYIHTYMGDGDPLPSFEGEPETVTVSGGIEEFGETIWDNLNEENRVALYVAKIRIDNGKVVFSKIFNKFE